MKLAFCIYRYFPHGGLARDLAGLVAECVRRGWQVRVYALSWEASLPGVAAVAVPVRGLTGPARYRRFTRWVRQHLSDHPVDLVVGMNKMPGLDVYFAGDSCYEEKARRERPWPYRLLPRYRHFAAYERAVFGVNGVRILALTEAQREAFRRYHETPHERFHMLPPALQEPSAGACGGAAPGRRKHVVAPGEADGRAWLTREFGLGEAAIALLFVGSGFRTKGLDRLLKAVAALPAGLARRVTLFVIGADRDRRFKRLARRLKIAERTRFLGGRDDVPRFLSAADALALPAYNEATGGVIVEALAAGLPALVTEACGYAPLVAEAQAGIVSPAPFDQGRLNHELEQLLTAPQRDAWRVQGRRFAAGIAPGGRAHAAADLFERFAGGVAQPTVAFCLHRVAPDDGPSRDFASVVRACLAAGFSARVYTMSWRPPPAMPAGLDVAVAPVASMTGYKRLERFAAWVAASLKRHPADCVVGFNKMAALDLYLVTEPCVERLADEARLRLYRSAPSYRQRREAERAVFRGATQVLAQNARQIEEYRGYYDVDARFVGPFAGGRGGLADTVPTGVREAFRRQRGLPDTAILMLHIGSGGLDRVLLTVAALPREVGERAWLLVVNGGRRWRGMANGLGFGDRVIFEDAAAVDSTYYNGSDLLLHWPHRDLAARPVLDAIRAGLPVLTTADVGFAEHVARAGAGMALAPPFDLEESRTHLAATLADDARRLEWGRNGARYFAGTEFGAAARVVEMIREVAHRRGRAVPAG